MQDNLMCTNNGKWAQQCLVTFMSLIHLSFLKLRKIWHYLLTHYFSAYSVKLIISYLFLWLIDVFRAFREITLPKPAMNCPTQRPCSDRSSCLDYSFPSDFNPSFFKCHNPCDAIVWDAQTSVFSYSSEHPFSFWPVPSFDSTLFLSSFFFF